MTANQEVMGEEIDLGMETYTSLGAALALHRAKPEELEATAHKLALSKWIADLCERERQEVVGEEIDLGMETYTSLGAALALYRAKLEELGATAHKLALSKWIADLCERERQKEG